MKIESTDFGVFTVVVPHEEANDFLMDEACELVNVNSAIDEATSHAKDFGKAYVLIEITQPAAQQASQGEAK